MKVCLSSRQNNKTLKLADEIKVKYRDRKIIPELAEKYPDKIIILEQDFNVPLDERDLKEMWILSKKKLIVCFRDFNELEVIKKVGIPFYWGYKAQNFYQLKALKDLGVVYVKVDAPLFFKMDEVKKYGIKLRAVPNIANSDGLPRKDGVLGTWIRPEDLTHYEDYVDIIEFEEDDIQIEQALYKTYFVLKEWIADLEILVKDLGHPGANGLIDPEGPKHRLNCGQRCLEHKECNICYNLLKLADSDKLKEYAKVKNKR